MSANEKINSNGGGRPLREELAALEHEQWLSWCKQVADEEDISEERIERWRQYWVPYEELEEGVKDHDRKWADHVLEILEDRGLHTESDQE